MTKEELGKEMTLDSLVVLLQEWQMKGFGNYPLLDSFGYPFSKNDSVFEQTHYDYKTGEETLIIKVG